MKKVSFKTLGCRLNQYETDALVTRFSQAGYQVVDYSERADITVINTCTVTSQSDQKSRNAINHTARQIGGGLVVVTGCMANNHRENLESNEKITYVVDNQHKSQIVSLVDAHLKGEMIHPDTLPGDVFGFETVEKSMHTRTSIKVQDGCDNFCTYCIVPAVRGRAVSRPLDQILENVKRVLGNGFREIVITGVNIGRYQHSNYRIEHVIERIVELPGDFRVRISSLEPDGFGTAFPSLFSHPKLAPHLHLCLQSGSDPVLLKMRRMYTVSSFLDIIDSFRKVLPDFNFTTDVIVGFPGETESDFHQTVKLSREVGFSHIHTFRYSARAGTRAYRMPGQVPEKIKTERSETIRTISRENRLDYMKTMLGKQERVLIEKLGPSGIAKGYGEHYLPVIFRTTTGEKNRFETVDLEAVQENDGFYISGAPVPYKVPTPGELSATSGNKELKRLDHAT